MQQQQMGMPPYFSSENIKITRFMISDHKTHASQQNGAHNY